MSQTSQTRMIHRILVATTLGVVISLSGAAQAHFNLTMPPAADTDTAGGVLGGGKGAPPCGPTSVSGIVTPVQGGHPLTVELTETIFHPGHYRFALSINSRDELPPDPSTEVTDAGQSISTQIQDPAVFPVLADGVFAHTTGTVPIPFSTTVNLPNITCAKCTLQVIEFMAEHRSNTGPDGGVAGGYFYHHCADLQITADPSLPAEATDAGVPDAESTGAGGGAVGGQTAAGGNSGSGGGSGGRTNSGGNSGSGSGGSNVDAGTQPTTGSSSSGCTIGGPLVLAPGAAAFLLFGLVVAYRRRRRS